MAAEFELTDDMRAVIGIESDPWPVEVTTTSVRAYARGVGYEDEVYYDLDVAKAAGYASLPLPSTFPGTPVFIPGKSNRTFSGTEQHRACAQPRLEERARRRHRNHLRAPADCR